MTKARELAELARTISDTSDATAITINSSEEVTFADDIFLADSKKVVLGAGPEIEMYSNGTVGYIDTAQLIIANAAHTNNIAKFIESGAVELYHNNSKKLETTSTGIDVTGTATANNLTLSNAAGVTSISVNAPQYSSSWTLYSGAGGANAIGFWDGSAYRLTVNSTGIAVSGSVTATNVTANNSAEGDTYFTGGTANSRLLSIFTSTNDGGANAGHNFKIASGQGAFIFGNATTANLLKVQTGGIDVTGTAKIEKSGQAINLDTPSSSQNVWLNFSDNGSAKWEISKNTANLLNIYSYDAGDNVMTFNGSNVGIGNDSPNRQLSLKHASQAEIGFKTGSVSNGALIYYNDSENQLLLRAQETTDHIAFQTGGTTERMQIASSGNIKVGNTADFSSPKMYVYGTAVNQNSGYYQLAIESDLAATSTPKSGISFRGEYNTSNGAHMDLGIIQGEKENATSGQTGGQLTFHTRTHNGNITERMRVMADGHILIGKQVAAQLTAGTVLYNNGQIYATATGTQPLVLTRKSSDGVMAIFYKDSGEVGRIGSASSDLYLGTGDTTLRFADGSDAILPTGTGSATRDGAIDLGHVSHRFKDLYLSGGVVFGSTGGAVTSKTLDDYEEGTWTPTLWYGTHTYVIQTGRYTKIGRLVTVWGQIKLSSRGSAGVELGFGNLPFTGSGAQSAYASVLGIHSGYGNAPLLPTGVDPTGVSVESTNGYLRGTHSTNSTYTINQLNSSGEVTFAFTYET